MASSIKIRARKSDSPTVSVKALIKHPMETGRRRDDDDKLIPAHFIQKVMVEHKGEVVFEAYWGTGVSKNPFVSFEFGGAEVGDKLKLSWFDNLGQSDSIETAVK